MAVLSGLDVDITNVHAAGTTPMMKGALEGLTRPDGTRRIPIVVPDRQMEQFISVCNTCNEKLVYLSPEEINLEKGTPVQIIGGIFDGVEGTFVKVEGLRNRRVVVSVPGITAVVIADITNGCIKVLE